MAHPEFIEEHPASLVDVKELVSSMESRDKELNFASNKVKEYVESFVTFSPAQRKGLHAKLVDLKLTRLKEEHFIKIIDFLPQTLNDLKIVLQAYPLSMPKKDQESIVQVVQEFMK